MNRKKLLIVVVSILVPLLVAALFVFTKTDKSVGDWVYKLPALNATINFICAILLITARVMIGRGHEQAHRRLMLTAFGLGALFLVSYVFYHASVPSVVYGDLDHDGVLSQAERAAAGGWRYAYLFVLLSHILLAVVALPLILLAVYYAWNDQRARHRRIVRFNFPVWLYVAVTGVMVYLFISPYY